MKHNYSDLLSTLGYEALDIIYGLKNNLLSEKEKRSLVRLLNLSNGDRILEAQIKEILDQNFNQEQKKERLLSLLNYLY
ncbi:hypothetical protein AN964_01850 [Heyndrickxia shackletonii]|uniref:Uncharacterized protein n=1 Tax=Heyndrickxia shackletonii TaxID=157838 RepID=A0A0Q3TFK9_9BACI|nr:hypothetical protein [Heyndrickxia shackletonii]KQL52409.1 hypothetical protein AN964_01850 [Heyndrickxia shackletonii]NEY99031.1 hypothetical protein [Heyndrickxia shackletonii]